MRVLLISAPIGAGHMRAAQAVAGALKRQRADVEIQIANVFDFIAPKYGQAVLRWYFKLLARFPAVYGRMYGWGNTNVLAVWGRNLLSRYLAKKMQRYIKDYQPSVIICTHATPAGIGAYLLKTKQIGVPVLAVITDYVAHRLWIYPEVSRYFVADTSIRESLCRQGISFACTQTTGIPVEYVFRQAIPRALVIERLDLKKAVKTVLMMGGGAGLLPMRELLLAFDGIEDELQIIAITGHNVQLFQELNSLQSALRHPLRVLGHIENVHEVMSVSDVLISKPGGLTAAEALSSELPLILYRPIPGQEEANARFLQEKGAALCACSTTEVLAFVRVLLFNRDRELFLRLRNNIRKLKRPLAADAIAKSVLSQSFP